MANEQEDFTKILKYNSVMRNKEKWGRENDTVAQMSDEHVNYISTIMYGCQLKTIRSQHRVIKGL